MPELLLAANRVGKTLKISHFSVAQARLAEVLKEHRQLRSNRAGGVSAKMTFREAAAIHLSNLDENLTMPRIGTKSFNKILVLVPGMPGNEILDVSDYKCRDAIRIYRDTEFLL